MTHYAVKYAVLGSKVRDIGHHPETPASGTALRNLHRAELTRVRPQRIEMRVTILAVFWGGGQ